MRTRILLGILMVTTGRAAAAEAPPAPPEPQAASAAPASPAPAVQAQPAPVAQAAPLAPAVAESTVHRHLGFYVHLDAGLGYTGTSANVGGAKMSGFSGSFSAAIGGAVMENLILAGEVWGTTAFSPSVSMGGVTVSSGSDTTFDLYGFGLNVTYYFMPANLFLSFTPSIGSVSVTTGGISGSTNSGFAAKLSLGKEWWVGDHWGLGLAAQFFFGINQDKGTDPPTWTTVAGGLAFSATFN
jgi:hypothetical protein